MVKSRVIILVKHFDGLPKLEDFRVVEEELRELEFGVKLMHKSLRHFTRMCFNKIIIFIL